MGEIGGITANRTILHIDLDGFYAQVESKRKGLGPEVPLAVQQWEDYAAKARGVTRHMRVAQAQQACPELVFVHVQTIGGNSSEEAAGAAGSGGTENAEGSAASRSQQKACLQRYRQASSEIMRVLAKGLSHGSIMEKGGLDEVYIDCTPQVEAELESLGRQYGLIPATRGQQTGTKLAAGGRPAGSGNDGGGVLQARQQPDGVAEAAHQLLHPASAELPQGAQGLAAGWPQALQQLSECVLECSIVEGGVQVDLNVEADRRLVVAAAVAKRLRDAVLQDPACGYTCSAGIAPNKMLAKLGSARNKPAKSTLILPRAVAGMMQVSVATVADHDPCFLCLGCVHVAKIKGLPVSKIRFLGGKLGQQLVDLCGAKTAGEVQAVPLATLATHLGSERARWIYGIVRGLDEEPVKPKGPIKSLNSCKSFTATTDMSEILKWLGVLAEELSERVAEDEWEHRRRPRALVLHWRGGSSPGVARSTRAAMPPHGKEGPSATAIAAAALALFKRLTDVWPCNHLSLSATEFHEPPVGAHQSIARFMAPNGPTTAARPPGNSTQAAASGTSPQSKPRPKQAPKPTGIERFIKPIGALTAAGSSKSSLMQESQLEGGGGDGRAGGSGSNEGFEPPPPAKRQRTKPPGGMGRYTVTRPPPKQPTPPQPSNNHQLSGGVSQHLVRAQEAQQQRQQQLGQAPQTTAQLGPVAKDLRSLLGDPGALKQRAASLKAPAPGAAHQPPLQVTQEENGHRAAGGVEITGLTGPEQAMGPHVAAGVGGRSCRGGTLEAAHMGGGATALPDAAPWVPGSPEAADNVNAEHGGYEGDWVVEEDGDQEEEEEGEQGGEHQWHVDPGDSAAEQEEEEGGPAVDEAYPEDGLLQRLQPPASPSAQREAGDGQQEAGPGSRPETGQNASPILIDLLDDEDEGCHQPITSTSHLAGRAGHKEVQHHNKQAEPEQQGVPDGRPGLQEQGAVASSPGGVSLGEVDVGEQRRILHDLEVQRLLSRGRDEGASSSRAPVAQGASKAGAQQAAGAGAGRGKGGKDKGGPSMKGQLSIKSMLSTKYSRRRQ